MKRPLQLESTHIDPALAFNKQCDGICHTGFEKCSDCIFPGRKISFKLSNVQQNIGCNIYYVLFPLVYSHKLSQLIERTTLGNLLSREARPFSFLCFLKPFVRYVHSLHLTRHSTYSLTLLESQ